MSKNKSVKKNYIYNLIYQIMVMIIPIITTPYLSRVLGAEGIGIYSYTVSIVTYFILFGTFGISTYAQREIAYIQDEKEKRSKIFFEIFFIRVITLSISMFIFYFIFASNGVYATYYKILLLEIIANMFDITWFFQGIEEFKKIVFRNVLIKIVFTILIFLLVKTKNDITIYILLYVFSNLIGNISLWINIKKYIYFNKSIKLEFKRHIKPTLLLFIPQIAIQIYTVLDKTMIGILCNDISEVGYYEQANKIVKISLTIITSLGTVMIPRIANMYANGTEEQIKEKLYKSFEFVFVLGMPIMFGLVAISDNFVPWFLGEEFEKASLIIKIFCPIIIFVGCANVIGTQYLIPTSQQNKYSITVVSSAIVNVIGNILLIPRLLSIGATISSVLAELVGIVIQFIFVRKFFNIVKIIRNGSKYLLSASIMGAIVYYISLYMKPKITSTILLVVIGILIYGFELLILNYKKISILIEKHKGRNGKYE